MFLLVSVRHVGAHPDELQHGVSIQSSINLVKTFPRLSRIPIIPSTQILARVFVYLPPFISQFLDFICRMVLVFILIYFAWRDTENQQLHLSVTRVLSCPLICCVVSKKLLCPFILNASFFHMFAIRQRYCDGTKRHLNMVNA